MRRRADTGFRHNADVMKWLVVLLALAASASAQTAPTPFQLETGHNTAACSNDNTQDYCIGGFPIGPGPWNGGWGDPRPNVLTPVIHPAVGDYGDAKGYFGNVSNGRGTPPWPDPAHPGDIHNLLYPGNTTRVLAIAQMWFSAMPPTAPVTVMNQTLPADAGLAGQKVIGYTSNDERYVAAMVDDLWNRGFDGVVAYIGTGPNLCAQMTLASGQYTGQPNNFTASCGADSAEAFIDSGVRKLQAAMLKHPAAQFQFVIQFAGSFKFPKTCGCAKPDCSGQNDIFQAQCIRDQMRAQLDYYASGFFKGANYLTPAPSSPVLQFFLDEAQLLQQCASGRCVIQAPDTTCASKTACWTAIWEDLRSYAKQQHQLTPYLIFRGAPPPCPVQPDAGSCTPSAAPVAAAHVEADGYYTFTEPTSYSTNAKPQAQIAGQEDWGRCAYQSTYCSWAAVPKLNNRRALYFGTAWKGVDDLFWSSAAKSTAADGLITSQRCGQTWLDTFAAPGRSFNRANQLPYMLVATYDDHQAGSAFQPGIDNCASVSASISGTAMQWATSFNDKYGSLKTLDHYRLFDSPDGAGVTVLLDAIPVSASGTLDLGALPLTVAPGNHTLYLKLVSKPGILNKFSKPMPATTLTLTKTGAGSITVGGTVINCPGTCTTTILAGAGSSVMLTAKPTTGHQFTGFSSPCTSPTNPQQCTLTMSAPTSLTATFN